MGQETIPAWAQDTPAWAQDSTTPTRAAPGAAIANAPSSQADKDEEAKAILYQEFGPAQQRYNYALASGNPEAIARAKGDLESLTREIANKKGVVPTINTPEAGAASSAAAPASGPLRMSPTGSTASSSVLPTSDVGKRVAYGAMGAAAAAPLAAVPIAKMRVALGRGADAVGNFVSRAVGSTPDVTSVDPAAVDTAGGEVGKGPGMVRWLAGQTGDKRRVPANVAAEVTSTKADDPTGAMSAIAKNAEGYKRLQGMNIDVNTLLPNPGGVIELAPSVQTLRSQVPPAPVPPTAVQSGLTALKNFGEKAGRVTSHPLALTAGAGFGVGASVPDIAEDLRKNDKQQAALDVLKGAAYGTAPALLPKAAQFALSKLGPLGASLANDYNAYSRANQGDYTGATISGLGGLASIAPLVFGGPLAWGVGATGAVAPSIVNYLRDRALREEYENSVGGGRGSVNPPLGEATPLPVVEPSYGPRRMAP